MDSELADRGRGRISLSESFNTKGRDGGSNNAARPLFYTELFESVCPEYMAMGMTYDQFWNGDNDAPRMCRKAYKRIRERADEDAWLHGLYVQQAIEACFSGKKNPFKYPDKPMSIDAKQEEEKRKDLTEQNKREQSTNKAKALMEIWAVNFNQKFEEKKNEHGDNLDGKEVIDNA